MNTFIIGDASQCIGCQACMIACARAHENVPARELVELSIPFHSRVTVINAADVTVPVQCRQCEDSPCAKACPVRGIVQKGSHIEVMKEKCIGCKSCVLACPFGAIKVVESGAPRRSSVMIGNSHGRAHNMEKSLFVVEKCDLCADCGSPACIDICPARALQLVDPVAIQRKMTLRLQQSASHLNQCRPRLASC